MKKADIKDIEIGDVFIQGGSPGHAVIIVDTAVNKKTGERIMMLVQSYMPVSYTHLQFLYFHLLVPLLSIFLYVQYLLLSISSFSPHYYFKI